MFDFPYLCFRLAKCMFLWGFMTKWSGHVTMMQKIMEFLLKQYAMIKIKRGFTEWDDYMNGDECNVIWVWQNWGITVAPI